MYSMRIQRVQDNTKFQSKNNPIKPFVMNTKYGRLYVAEISQKELKDEKFLRNLVRFFIKNFASSTKDPYWLEYNKNPQNRGKMIDGYIDYLRPVLKSGDDNLTLLMAKDKVGRTCGACLSYSLSSVKGAKDTTCYVEGLAVDSKYRGCKLGERLLNTTMEANKKTFTDVFLKGEMFAAGFYKRMGFETMTADKPSQADVVKVLAAQGEGYPDYIKFFTKALQNSKPRWFEVVSERLKNS